MASDEAAKKPSRTAIERSLLDDIENTLFAATDEPPQKRENPLLKRVSLGRLTAISKLQLCHVIDCNKGDASILPIIRLISSRHRFYLPFHNSHLIIHNFPLSMFDVSLYSSFTFLHHLRTRITYA
ncbi:MAG TPA: hypothetical protein VGH19_03880 [Verrucomicrobiae bacterium]